MRQIIVKVPRGQGKEVLGIADAHQGVNLASVNASDQSDLWDLVIMYVTNQEVSPLLAQLEALPDIRITLFPHDVVPMAPPHSQVAEHISEVTPRSPVEVWLNALQSIGSWRGFLGYAIAAGIIVWIGMYTNTSYLLVAAMLIAPFAGPAMNVAIATATGERRLLRRNLVRYFMSLALMIAVTAVLSLILQLERATIMMVDASEISSVAILSPLVAGAAGALNLIQDEKNSLVSGTAVGVLVAASLAPPAGLIGMAAAIGRWDMAVNGVFVLMTQLVAINLAGALVFRVYGLDATGSRYERGRTRFFYVSLAVSAVMLVALLGWQFSSSPGLQRATRAQRAAAETAEVVAQNDLVTLVEANFRFTRPVTEGQETLLGVVYVEPSTSTTVSAAQIEESVMREIQQHLFQEFQVKPLVSVTFLDAP